MENGAFAPMEQMLHFPKHFQICDISKASKGVSLEKRVKVATSGNLIIFYTSSSVECGGSVVEYLTQDQGVVGSSLKGGTVLCP